MAVTEVSTPIFLAQGERDRQVFVDTEFARWREILGDRSDVRFETYPEANHYFVPGPAPTQLWGDPVEAEHVVEALVADVAERVDVVT